MRIASLYRYPVKGLSPERLTSAQLEANAYFPGDRLFAIENGPSGFDPAEPVHQPKIKYLMLMRHEALATLRTRYDDPSGELVIARDGQEVLRADTATPAGQGSISAFFETFMPEALRGQPRLLRAPAGYRFTDSRSGFVSLINLASVADLEKRIGSAVDPLRFRGNVMVEGLGPWRELDLVGRELTTASGVKLQVIKRIERCAATNVDPQTGARDLQLPKALMTAFGHVDCGIYCQITTGGRVAEGERFDLVDRPAPLGIA
ncbi:MOSC domain-containing protein [Bosea sp. (in: a-proteobacteria)]|uniref:MOSC domain-containing protein n=1 Tax=Bosea sp. (in: a-proteobacteria) TaxID=1871050 RepID=UPI002735A9E2|nr:MOSC N-terminal beta barrel domain-containing protein [Bosea sp. (in: a-proteobacteria)]MDP3255536.1 MOSC domain-containing protein [Bosea sp. (in: a-proteobacteria)]